MMKKIKISVVTVLAACALYSCAQEKEEAANDVQKRILDAYVAEYYPSATKAPSGLVYISKTEGTGDTLENFNGAYVQYTTKTLAGNYSSTNDIELAKRLGVYSKSKYYGPHLYEIGYGTTSVGVEEMLLGMRTGGTVTAIVPPWLTAGAYGGSQSASESMFHTFELKAVIKDIIKFQLDSMASYAKKNYSGLDTTSYGFYFKKLNDSQKDTIAKDATVNVRYVGRLLDGFVFDTNIADTAKKYGIYSTSRDYSVGESVTLAEDINTMTESSGLVKGFCMAVQKMKRYEEKAFTMFYSNLGYAASGTDGIGAYQPLIFWLYVDPKEE